MCSFHCNNGVHFIYAVHGLLKEITPAQYFKPSASGYRFLKERLPRRAHQFAFKFYPIHSVCNLKPECNDNYCKYMYAMF